MDGYDNNSYVEEMPNDLFYSSEMCNGSEGMSTDRSQQNHNKVGGETIFNPQITAATDITGSVSLSWSNINVYANLPGPSLVDRLLRRKKYEVEPKQKQILFDVTGKAPAGTLLAIMGASGAGKTTLMNVLAYQKLGSIKVEGTVKVNKRVIGKQIKRICAYVTQDDLFIGTLTVKEHLIFQAMLRMDKIFAREQKRQRALDVLSELGLTNIQNCVIGIKGRIHGISRGAARRLAFASEILTDPSLLFVDEPTSGLDSFMAQSVVGALQKLATKGKTILATIHQPSSEVFEMFDCLLLMAEGRVAYAGSRSECLAYFSRLNYPCLINYNPADHYIGVLAIRPGREQECRERTKSICDHFELISCQEKVEREIFSFIDPRDVEQSSFKVDTSEQFRWLLWRSYNSSRREPFLTAVRFIEQLALAVLTGLVYLQVDNDQNIIRNIRGALFFVVLASTFGSITSAVYVFPSEFPVIFKEQKNGIYRTSAYFFAKTIAEFPYNVVGPMLFSIISFWMVGYRKDAAAFFIYVTTVLLINQGGLSFGYAISAMSSSVQMAVGLAFPLVLPLYLIGGFFTVNSALRDYVSWLSYISWFKHGYEALNINQWNGFGTINCNLPANSSSTCISNGDVVLEFLKIDKNDLGWNIGLLVAVVIAFRCLALLILFVRTRKTGH